MAASALESAVEKQIEENSNDIDNNLNLLKLYQFRPELTSTRGVCLVLIKALMQLPSTGFHQCVCLLGPKLKADVNVSELVDVVALLECGSFLKFWARIKESHSGPSSYCWVTPLVEIPGLLDAVRNYMVGVVSATFDVASVKIASELLNVNAEQLSSICAKSGWILEGDTLRLPRTEEELRRRAPKDQTSLQAKAIIGALRK